MIQSVEKTSYLYDSNSLNAELFRIISAMPEGLKAEVLLYAEYLLEKKLNKSTNSESPQNIEKDTQKKYRVAGTMKGAIVMAEDFDEPLEEMKEYM